MPQIGALLEAIIAIPKIGAMFEKYIGMIVAWYLSNVKAENGQAIQDALAFHLKNIDTKEGRLESAKRWQAALSRGRSEL